jgi:hypothetical protein
LFSIVFGGYIIAVAFYECEFFILFAGKQSTEDVWEHEAENNSVSVTELEPGENYIVKSFLICTLHEIFIKGHRTIAANYMRYILIYIQT